MSLGAWNFCDEDCRQRAEQFLNQAKCDPAEMLRKAQKGQEY